MVQKHRRTHRGGRIHPENWQTWLVRWSRPLTALLCVATLTVSATHLIDLRHDSSPGQVPAPRAQAFADTDAAVFADSAIWSGPAVSAQLRRAGLPTDPVAGL